mgnify:CR=1 FL=1
MKSFALTLFMFGLPSIARADGGHPEAGQFHLLAHLLFFGIPVILAITSPLLMRGKKHRRGGGKASS